MKPWQILVVLAFLGIGVLAIASGGGAPPEPPEPPDNGGPVPSTTLPPKPIAIGEATDPMVAPFMAQLAARFISAGVNIQRVKPFDLVVMSKAPLVDGPDPGTDKTRPVAIPPLVLWDPLTKIASHVDIVLSQTAMLGANPPRLTGYRAVSYNAAVGGAPKSRHIFADAIDVWVPSAVIAAGGQALKDYREALRMAFARWIVRQKQVGWGFGVYTNDIHVDVGRKPGSIVTWERGGEYIAKAKAELGIA